MLTASTPASWQRRALASMSAISGDFGESNSTLLTRSPRASFAAKADFAAIGTASLNGASAGRISTRAVAGALNSLRHESVLAISRMCASVVPQHPPTPRRPRRMNSLAFSVKYSGLAM